MYAWDKEAQTLTAPTPAALKQVVAGWLGCISIRFSLYIINYIDLVDSIAYMTTVFLTHVLYIICLPVLYT